MVVIVVYSHVYGGWHAASRDAPVQAESIHLVPVCRINAQQLHLVQYRGALLAEDLPELFLVSGRYQLLHGGHGGTVFLQRHVTHFLRVLMSICMAMSVLSYPFKKGTPPKRS